MGNLKDIPCLGAVIGDMIGQPYEFDNIKTTDFPLFNDVSHFTDDSVTTCAVADWLKHTDRSQEALVDKLVTWCKKYPHAGYGGGFYTWVFTPQFLKDYKGNLLGGRKPYYSFGDGSAMRCSPCGWVTDDVNEAMDLAEQSALPTHNHPEGIRGAKALAAAVCLARNGKSKEEIRDFVEKTFYYDLHRTIEEIRPVYKWEIACQNVVPEAIIAFLDSTDYESAIRLAVSIGGDSDTIACITGAIAHAFYGLPPVNVLTEAINRLPDDIMQALIDLI